MAKSKIPVNEKACRIVINLIDRCAEFLFLSTKSHTGLIWDGMSYRKPKTTEEIIQICSYTEGLYPKSSLVIEDHINILKFVARASVFLIRRSTGKSVLTSKDVNKVIFRYLFPFFQHCEEKDSVIPNVNNKTAHMNPWRHFRFDSTYSLIAAKALLRSFILDNKITAKKIRTLIRN